MDFLRLKSDIMNPISIIQFVGIVLVICFTNNSIAQKIQGTIVVRK